ncbi:MAG: MerR family transcriptional regulator [Anaerolineae bacterium]|nr:MerR family transcriptional regulator [Anaerolineae bacterium]
MSSETYQSPQGVAKQLDISPASLRRWSDEFTDFLSKGAGADKERSHRRYLESDVETLNEIKELMSNGMTYEQVRQQLTDDAVPSIEPDEISEVENDPDDDYVVLPHARRDEPSLNDDDDADDDNDDTPPTFEESLAVVASNGSESPALNFLTNTLTTLSDSQKSVLNSQAANRELMGVLLQDNFNLKEENNRLRERILEVERDVARSRQEDEWRREALRQELEAKISAANQLASEAIVTARSVEAPQIKAVETKPGCLGMFLGRGGTQIITTQPRKQQKPLPPAAANGLASGLTQQPVSSGSPSHPKPSFPPE